MIDKTDSISLYAEADRFIRDRVSFQEFREVIKTPGLYARLVFRIKVGLEEGTAYTIPRLDPKYNELIQNAAARTKYPPVDPSEEIATWYDPTQPLNTTSI